MKPDLEKRMFVGILEWVRENRIKWVWLKVILQKITHSSFIHSFKPTVLNYPSPRKKMKVSTCFFALVIAASSVLAQVYVPPSLESGQVTCREDSNYTPFFFEPTVHNPISSTTSSPGRKIHSPTPSAKSRMSMRGTLTR